jgi:hypothetical protein
MKASNIKFHGNQSSGSSAGICGEIYGRTDMTKLIGVFRDYANAPKNPKTTIIFSKTAVKI